MRPLFAAPARTPIHHHGTGQHGGGGGGTGGVAMAIRPSPRSLGTPRIRGPPPRALLSSSSDRENNTLSMTMEYVETTQPTQLPFSCGECSEDTSSPVQIQLPQHWGKLVPLTHEGKMAAFGVAEPWVLRATDQPSFIGRGSQSTFKVLALTVSSKHCSLFVERGMPFVMDHGSSNGTFVNGKKLEPNKKFFLVHGDVISLLAPTSSNTAPTPPLSTTTETGNGGSFVAPANIPPPAIKRMKPDRQPSLQFAFEGGLRASPSSMERANKCPFLKPAYVLLDELGKGNFATVYRALNRETGERVAIKIIERARFQNVVSARWVDQVSKEVDTLRKLSHPAIVEFRDVIRNDEFVCVVTELLAGGELFDRLISRGAYTETRAKILVRRILDAVAYLHDHGIVHRDLKPENIVMVSTDDDVAVKLVDFGVAAEESGGRKTFCGSMSYVAPEVLSRRGSIMRRGTYGKSVDMWSFGVIVYIVLCGRPPFDEEEDPSTMHHYIDQVLRFQGYEWAHVSDEAKDFVSRCLEINEANRITARNALAHPWMVGVVDM